VRVTFWGTRGSIPAPGSATIRYGGNTSCVEVRSDNGTLIICDSGTGIRELGLHLMATSKEVKGHLLFSHTHWDHIQGWPFFTPALARGNEFTLHAVAGAHRSLETALANQMEYTYFPITLHEMDAHISFEEAPESSFSIDGVKVTPHRLNHTTACLGYRIEADGKTLIYASDTEPNALGHGGMPTPDEPEPELAHEADRALAEFVEGADLLVMDAQYTDDEYAEKKGWGHSTTSYATDVAVLGRVKRMALFHHDPAHEDDAVDRIVKHARKRAAAYRSDVEIFGAAEGHSVTL
jgi:phosphoribosyl 1,2-cyclic phosphodiesterase